MRKILNLFAAITLIGGLIFFSSCGDDDDDTVSPPNPPTAQEEVAMSLADGSPWTPDTNTNAITLEGEDRTADFQNFTITFTETTYTSSGGGEVWPDASGANWTFVGEDGSQADQIVRPDGVEVDVSVSADQLILTFTIDDEGNPGGRTTGIGGEWTLRLDSGS